MSKKGPVLIIVLLGGGLVNFALLGEWRLFVGAGAGFLVAAPLAYSYFRRRNSRRSVPKPPAQE
ncbi:MAG: hypothetical protein AMXMBFR80_28670 [Dehalococcoidia bacterium]|jgi:hypothetical protein